MYFHATAILVYRDRLTDIDGQTNMNEAEYDLIEEHFLTFRTVLCKYRMEQLSIYKL